MHESVATISNPEFINLQPLDINPLMSECEIKVMYLGKNRNGSYIDEDTAVKMAATLRGAPIVGYFRKDKEDFHDHGELISIQGSEIEFKTLTVPYGFVSPDAKVWFQTFYDKDDFGNDIERKYLMTTGYLWTGQFEEAKLALEENGRPHSMEIDADTVEGHWADDYNTGCSFFIITDAIFSKLCILGEDVEPCFEGSSVTAPRISKTFTKVDNQFKKTLYSMMQDLQFALKGGMDMTVEETIQQPEEKEVVENFTNDSAIVDEPVVVEEPQTEVETEEPVIAEEPVVEPEPEVEPTIAENFSAEGEGEPVQAEGDQEPAQPQEKIEDNFEESANNKNEEITEALEQYSLLKAEYEALQSKFEQLETEYQALVQFKQDVEDSKKADMINSFYLLDDEDKKEILENKSKYSLDEIESKLSIMYTRKQLSVQQQEAPADTVATVYNVSADSETTVPAWVRAVQKTEEKM